MVWDFLGMEEVFDDSILAGYSLILAFCIMFCDSKGGETLKKYSQTQLWHKTFKILVIINEFVWSH